MKVEAYIHSLKDKANDRHVLGEAEIIKSIGDNLFLLSITAFAVLLFLTSSRVATMWTMCMEFGRGEA